MKIAVLTDSAAGINNVEAEKLGILIVPIPIIIAGNMYNDGLDINMEQLSDFEKLKESAVWGQISVDTLVKKLNILKDNGITDVLAIHSTGGLNTLGSHLKAGLLAASLNGYVFDSKTIGIAQGDMVRLACTLLKESNDVEYVIEKLYQLRRHSKTYIRASNISSLVKTGYLMHGTMSRNKSLFSTESLWTINKKGNLEMISQILTKNSSPEIKKEFEEMSLMFRGSLKISVMNNNPKSYRFEKEIYNFTEDIDKVDFRYSYLMPSIASLVGVKSTVITIGLNYEKLR